MPHKHKRQKLSDTSAFDLPPTAIAKSLPAFQKTPKDNKHAASKSKKADPPKPLKIKNKSKGKTSTDDTPKSFARLMQFHTLGKRLPSGLDDGTTSKQSKKRKLADTQDSSANDATTTSTTNNNKKKDAKPNTNALPPTQPVPTILPGERLADFAARVDQALPMTHSRSTAKVAGVKERTTKHNKRLARMQAEWRAEEQRRQDRRQDALEEWEDESERETDVLNQSSKSKSKKGGKKKKKAGRDADEDEEDPWKALEQSRADAKQRNLQDVVLAPPLRLKKVQSRFKEVGGASVDVGNVPGSVGSLRKREEMGEARRAVIEGYRKMMGQRKGQ